MTTNSVAPPSVINACGAALRDLLRPRMLGLLLWPLLGAAVLWTGLSWWFWDAMVEGLLKLAGYGASSGLMSAAALHGLSGLIVFVMLVIGVPLLTLTTAQLVIAIISLPVIINDIAARRFPNLQRREGGSAWGSAWNGLIATLGYLLAWLLVWPLLFFAPFALPVPLLLNAALNLQLFRYDSLAEHASPEEYQALKHQAGGGWWSVALISSAFTLIPVLNLLTPLFASLIFVHFSLQSLNRLRARSSSP